MAMIRVSSYRKLFEEEQWSQGGGAGMQCGEQYRSSARGAAADHECQCEQLDFVAARALNKEGLDRFAKDRTLIAALNDRLANLIEMARCFEVENDSLEAQIMALEDRLEGQQASSTTTITVPDYSLEAVVERLRKEKEQILCDTEELRGELECLQQEYEKAVQQRTFIQFEREDVAGVVDAVTAECLALREQVAIYEQQLANMEAQHELAVESLVEPAEGTAAAGAMVEFCSPDSTAAIMDIKEYYCQLAECIQYECKASAGVAVGDGKQLAVAGAAGVKMGVTDPTQITDVNELKKLIAELEKELAELEKCGEELEDEIEMKRAEHLEEIAELECRIEEMRHQQADLQAQMREQCGDYEELLSQKMARDMEIAAYRGLVEEEEERLCYL